jgi:MHS family proline/betaine transporter-like MFS transporter
MALTWHHVCVWVRVGAVGNVLEWFDFAVFGALADVIGDVFFPDSMDSKVCLCD